MKDESAVEVAMPQTTPLHVVAHDAKAVFAIDTGWLMPDHFGDVARECRAAAETAVLFDHCHWSKIDLAGPDAVTFLHNLCTNDIKNLKPGASCEAFLTTHKARVLAHVWVVRLAANGQEFLHLTCVPGLALKVAEHLNHHLVSEQVEIADRTGELALIHLAGPAAENILGKSALAGATVQRNPLVGESGFDVFCGPPDAARNWQALVSAGAVPAGLQAWEILRIEAGLPSYGKDIDDNRLVMEVGRTRQAISFTKGCYLGQEPVVMARDRGQVNRTLMGLRIRGQVPAGPGTRILRDGNEIGQVTSSAVSPRLGPIALAYLRRGSQDPGTIVQLDPAGDAEIIALPFEG
jgi:tRNA-modifying protein YgfZ